MIIIRRGGWVLSLCGLRDIAPWVTRRRRFTIGDFSRWGYDGCGGKGIRGWIGVGEVEVNIGLVMRRGVKDILRW